MLPLKTRERSGFPAQCAGTVLNPKEKKNRTLHGEKNG